MLGIREGGNTLFRRKSFVSQCRTISWRNPSVLCFRNFPVAKKFMDKGVGVLRSSVEKIFSHSAEKFLRGIFYCFINFRYGKMLGIKERGGWGINNVCRKIFVS